MHNVEFINFDHKEYQKLCVEMKELLLQEKGLAARKEGLRKSLIDKSGGDRMEYGIKLTTRRSSGSIDYKRYCEVNHIDLDTLSFFRKPDRVFWERKSY